MTYNQNEFDVKCEWRIRGVEELSSVLDVIIIVDILSFPTCVDVATNNGAIIYPCSWKDESAIDYAKSLKAAMSVIGVAITGFYPGIIVLFLVALIPIASKFYAKKIISKSNDFFREIII